MKVKREESIGLLKKLEHCVVASWKDNSGGEDDLEKLGSFGQSRGSLKVVLVWLSWKRKRLCWILKIWNRLDVLSPLGIA